MEAFHTLEEVKELFDSVNCTGSENSYFAVYKDASKNGGMVKAMEYPYDALLIGLTESGFGIFYLKQDGIPFKYDLAKMKVVDNSYFFVKNEEVKSISIKNWFFINSKTKRVVIKLNNKKVHQLCANIDEAALPYHKEGLSRFMEKYGE